MTTKLEHARSWGDELDRLNPGDLAREEIKSGKRWSLLQAVAFIASGQQQLVDDVNSICPVLNALPHLNSAHAAHMDLARKLSEQPVSEVWLDFSSALRRLLSALRSGEVVAYVDGEEALLINVEFQGLSYSQGMVGLRPSPVGDARFWGFVLVNSDDVRRVRTLSPNTIPAADQATTGKAESRAGRKAEWDWPALMGELVRIADQDGLHSIGIQADVERWAIGWLAERHGREDGPSVSRTRDHIAPVFKAIEASNRRRQRLTE